MKREHTICDMCGDNANIPVVIKGNAAILINSLDGHGDYRFTIADGKTYDLCQYCHTEAFRLLRKFCGDPGVEK